MKGGEVRHFLIPWLLFSFAQAAFSELPSPCCKGRIDIGPAYVNVDMLESGKTKRSIDLRALRCDANFLLFGGLSLKPSGMISDGKANLTTASLGLGFCFPLSPTFTLTPSGGITETHFKSRVNFRPYALFHLRERFYSYGGYGALDASWTFFEKWRLYGTFQYTWSLVKTTVRPLFKTKNRCQGPSYALAIERDLNDYLSLTLSGGYNLSLSKEKHGLRGKGVKLGLAYWF